MNFLQIIQLILLFLMSLNFQNLYFYIIVFAFAVCTFAHIRHFRVDIIAVLLAVISLCYILFYPPTRDSYTTILKQFAYPMCYLIGLNLFNVKNTESGINDNPDKQIRLSVLVVAFGTFGHYLLNASINISSLLRNTEDYWTGDVVSATEQALLAVMMLAVFSVWLVGDYPVWRKVVSVLGLVTIFAYNFVLAGRTIIVLAVICLCVAFVFTQKYLNSGGRIRSYLFLSVILIALLVMFLNNVWGMREWVLDSNLSNRFDTQEAVMDIRFQRKIIYIKNMFGFPLGGGDLREAIGGYAHELYLDAYSDVGILGYGLIVAFVIVGLVNVIKIIISERFALETRCLSLCVFLLINIVFFLEPILQGMPWLFCIYSFLVGVIRANTLQANKGNINGV